jgi:RNA polymerase sigma factor (sigma-70 family)
MMRSIPDIKMMNGLREQRNNCIRQMYREYLPVAKSIVEKNSGTNEDAEDVFQDSLVILYTKVSNGPITLNCSLKTYFYSICQNIWRQRLDRKWRIQLEESMAEEPDEMYEIFSAEIKEEEMEKSRLLRYHFLTLPAKCQKVLELFLHDTPLKEIASRLGYKNEEYAKARKYMCKNMLRKRIMDDPRCKPFLNHG